MIHDVMTEYEKRMKELNALDFDDLLLKTLVLLADHPPVLQQYRERFQYVLVDEYQDTNKAQYEIIRLLTSESRNLCVVGDDDQSIYGWRGADIRNILDFEKDFPDAKIIKLEQIAEVSGFFLKHLPLFFLPPSIAIMGVGDDILSRWPLLLSLCIVFTLITIAAGGISTQFLIRRQELREARRNHSTGAGGKR